MLSTALVDFVRSAPPGPPFVMSFSVFRLSSGSAKIRTALAVLAVVVLATGAGVYADRPTQRPPAPASTGPSHVVAPSTGQQPRGRTAAGVEPVDTKPNILVVM